MYRSHFGLHELPFGLTPDTSFAYTCASHQEAIEHYPAALRLAPQSGIWLMGLGVSLQAFVDERLKQLR